MSSMRISKSRHAQFRILALLCSITAIALQANTAQSQMPADGPLMPLFEERAPKVGEPAPDITIFDDQGNPVNIRDLASENYTVLVLGCLT